MISNKHFNYDGNVHIKDIVDQPVMANAIVTKVEFLTPARLTIIVNGEMASRMVNVDIINKKVYDKDGNAFLSEEVFKHLDQINHLPEDFFAAPQEVREVAAAIKDECDQARDNILGATNE